MFYMVEIVVVGTIKQEKLVERKACTGLKYVLLKNPFIFQDNDYET